MSERPFTPRGDGAGMHVTKVRVRYGETDQMGVVYHANYLHYFELGRIEVIRSRGVTYAELEKQGVLLPVIEMAARFFLPARYDDVLLIGTRVTQVSAVRVRFDYVVHREGDPRRLAEGHTVLASVTRDGRPRRLPDAWRRLLEDAREEGA